MQAPLRTRFQRGDILAIALVLVLALAVALAFLPGREEAGGMVEIYQDGNLIRSYSLDEEVTMEVPGDYSNVISISGGRAAITQSTCPGEDCVHSGWISSAGRSIVCLPNRVEIRIVGAQADVDFVVG